MLGGALLAACAAAMPPESARDPGWMGADELAKAPGSGAAAPDASTGDEPNCPYGKLEDPHRGFVRCLEPGEADAGFPPLGAQPVPPPDAGSPAPADAGAADASPGDAGRPDDAGPPDAAPPMPDAGIPAPIPLVEVGEPAYENGDVPKIEKILLKARGEIARCVADHGGLRGQEGSLKVQFLVRARGRAEGVEILSSKGVTPAAEECVRLALKNKPVGAPSADPVGVTVTVTLKRAKGDIESR